MSNLAENYCQNIDFCTPFP